MGSYAGLTPEAAASEIEALLAVFQLREVLQSHPHDLSGGQQQQTALAMMLLMKPDILLLDEPTKGLDPAAKDRLAALLQQLRGQGISILIVTHDVEFAAKHASRCALLFDGGLRRKAHRRSSSAATTSIPRQSTGWCGTGCRRH